MDIWTLKRDMGGEFEVAILIADSESEAREIAGICKPASEWSQAQASPQGVVVSDAVEGMIFWGTQPL